jgi:hypothetical protein
MDYDNYNPPGSWKRVTRVIMIRAGFKDKDIMKTGCVARNTVKTIRSELEESNKDYEKVVERKKGKTAFRLPQDPGVHGEAPEARHGGPQQVLHQGGGGVGD